MRPGPSEQLSDNGKSIIDHRAHIALMAAENVLGIVGCVVLADELSCVLSRDRDLYRTFIVENEAGEVLRDKLGRRGVEAEMLSLDELERARSQDRYSVLIWMNPAGPHDNQEELRALVKGAAERLSGSVGLCLCFYGLCRNSLWKIDRMGEEVGLPMMILTDLRGEAVDDCFGANIGGKKEYLDTIVNNRGTIFVSPGYAENWKRRQSNKPLDKVIEQVENLRFIFQRMEYTKVMKLQNGLGDVDKFEERVDSFARIFDLGVMSMVCGLGVFEHSYSLAKMKMAMKRPMTLAPSKNWESAASYNPS